MSTLSRFFIATILLCTAAPYTATHDIPDQVHTLLSRIGSEQQSASNMLRFHQIEGVVDKLREQHKSFVPKSLSENIQLFLHQVPVGFSGSLFLLAWFLFLFLSAQAYRKRRYQALGALLLFVLLSTWLFPYHWQVAQRSYAYVTQKTTLYSGPDAKVYQSLDAYLPFSLVIVEDEQGAYAKVRLAWAKHATQQFVRGWIAKKVLHPLI